MGSTSSSRAAIESHRMRSARGRVQRWTSRSSGLVKRELWTQTAQVPRHPSARARYPRAMERHSEVTRTSGWCRRIMVSIRSAERGEFTPVPITSASRAASAAGAAARAATR